MPDAPALRVLIVDDEPLARARLRSLLAEAPTPCAVVGEVGDVDSALACTARQAVDLVLLDIHMPGTSGLELAAAWQGGGLDAQPAAPLIVFVTAHSEHALRAFELDALDYLTKPVRRERLAQALAKAAQQVAARQSRAAPGEPASPAHLVVNERGRVLRLPLGDVIYLKAQDKYVTIVTAERRFVVDDALAELEAHLGDAALRIHRHTVVNKGAVRALERRAMPGEDGASWAVRVAPGDEWLAVSRRQLAAVRAALSG